MRHAETGKDQKGYKESWTGYTSMSLMDKIPVGCLLTSASVHDSQVAIPLMSITGQRITYLRGISLFAKAYT